MKFDSIQLLFFSIRIYGWRVNTFNAFVQGVYNLQLVNNKSTLTVLSNLKAEMHLQTMTNRRTIIARRTSNPQFSLWTVIDIWNIRFKLTIVAFEFFYSLMQSNLLWQFIPMC